jgi:hypothetical protein
MNRRTLTPRALWTLATLGALSTLAIVVTLTALATSATQEVDWLHGKFAGTEAEVKTLMGHYAAIQLTPEQEAVRVAALEDLPAFCCSRFSAATCCCECNLSRTLWGLSKFLITQKDATAPQVRAAVVAWTETVNPGGYAGNACFTGGCIRPMREGGCGGMQAERVVF